MKSCSLALSVSANAVGMYISAGLLVVRPGAADKLEVVVVVLLAHPQEDVFPADPAGERAGASHPVRLPHPVLTAALAAHEAFPARRSVNRRRSPRSPHPQHPAASVILGPLELVFYGNDLDLEAGPLQVVTDGAD